MHSFFYAFSCLVVCLVYFLHKSNWRPDKKALGKAVLAVTISIGMAAVLLLPTALNILSTTKDAGGFMSQPMDMVDLKIGRTSILPVWVRAVFTSAVLPAAFSLQEEETNSVSNPADLHTRTGCFASTQWIPLSAGKDFNPFCTSHRNALHRHFAGIV